MRRIGILTGGADAPGLNAVVRAATLAAKQAGVEIVGVRNGFRGLVEADFMGLDPVRVLRIHRRGGSILGCDNIFRGDAADFTDGVRRASLDGLIVVGGDGSLTQAGEMAELMPAAAIVGVPKTIDNDVAGTEATIGFDTAVGAVENACERLIDTAESHRRVMIVEVMGRHSGFIALYGALSGGAGRGADARDPLSDPACGGRDRGAGEPGSDPHADRGSGGGVRRERGAYPRPARHGEHGDRAAGWDRGGGGGAPAGVDRR